MSEKKPFYLSGKTMGVLSVVALLLPALSCGGGEERHSINEKYYLVASNIKLPYWQAAAAGFRRAAVQMGIKSFNVVGPDSYDTKAELEAFQNAVKNNPAGILVSPADPELMGPAIDAAIEKQIPVITIDSDAPNSKRLLFIGTDNYQAGVMGGKLAAKKLNGKGSVIVYTMPEQANLRERLRGYQEVFAASPGIKITQQINVKGDPREAFDRTMEVIDKGPKPDAFVCLEAVACQEVAEVLRRKEIKDKVVVAMDTEPLTLEGIQKGIITATIEQKPYTMAYFGLKMVEELHRNKLPSIDKFWVDDPFSPLPYRVDTGLTMVDKSNVDRFIKQRNEETAPASK